MAKNQMIVDADREVRVLVAEPEFIEAQRLVDFLTNNGYYVRFVRNGNELRNMLKTWRPDFILAEMMLPELNALELLKMLSEQNLLGEEKVRVMVMSSHNNPANVRECMRKGAVDYVVQPYKYVDLLRRLILHSQPKRTLAAVPEDSKDNGSEGHYYMHLTDLVLREANKPGPAEDRLFNLSQMASLPLKGVRCSITECDAAERRAWVRASSDDKSLKRLRLDLYKYPELVYVVTMQKTLALENLADDPTMNSVHGERKSISFNSMIAAPIWVAGDVWGVLHLRLPDSRTSISDYEIRFVQIVAHAAGLVLGRLAAAENALKSA